MGPHAVLPSSHDHYSLKRLTSFYSTLKQLRTYYLEDGRRHDMLRRIMRTDDDSAALVLRVALGLAMLPHGAQKLLGWFGGYGLSGTLGFFQQQLGIPAALGLLAVIAESFGALGLIFGFLGR